MANHTLQTTASTLVRFAVPFAYDGLTVVVPSLDLRLEAEPASADGYHIPLGSQLRAVKLSSRADLDTLTELLARAERYGL